MSDKVKEVVSEEKTPVQRLDANQVLNQAQTLIAQNLSSAEEVRDVVCALVGDILINGFKTEQLTHRIIVNTAEGQPVTAFITLSAELFQKVSIQPVPQPVHEEVEKPE
ncbi:hypothetical protein [Citrobacter sp.]|uniref:hypothetical protein n=1 Tax=Citrobacter sp. TaxID=1896336 RepID=UPI002FC976D3